MTYLDHAATTPMRPAAIEAWRAEQGAGANASSLHTHGRAARRSLEESREQLAGLLGCRADEVVLTSGGTEADNLALKGLFWSRTSADPHRDRVLVSSVEHHAVLDAADWLAARGATVVRLPVGPDGELDLAALAAELDEHGDRVALVAVMQVNNEIGTVQPVARVVELAGAAGVPVHVDAVQALGHLPLGPAAGAATVAVSAHKVGGPAGVGALVVRRGVQLTPLLHGGEQQRGLRPGTADVAGARAFAVAAAEAAAASDAARARLAELHHALGAGALAAVPGVHLSGPPLGSALRHPGIVHLVIEGCDGEALLLLLDREGVSASTGSACQAGVQQPSHVLLALGVDAAASRGALRLSLGWSSTEQDVAHALAVLPGAVAQARAAWLPSG